MSKPTKEPTKETPNEVDAYLARLPAGTRAALESLRRLIRRHAPDATEVMSYQVPTFRHHGALVSFAASAKGCSFYVMSAEVMAAHADELAGHDTAKGTVRFAIDEPLPAALVKKLVLARIRENEAKQAGKARASARSR